MTTPENGSYYLGKVLYPIATSTGNSELKDIDLPVWYLLDFCSSLLNIYMGARWNEACLAANRPDLASSIVATQLPYNPVPFLQTANWSFPILAMYRTAGEIKEQTRSYHRITSTIEVVWIAPPLQASEMEHLAPFQVATLATLTDRIEQGWDANYNGGEHVGALAGFAALGMNSYSFEVLPKVGTNLVMPTVVMQMKIWEENRPVDNQFGPFTGIDGYEQLNTVDGYAPVPNIVEFNTDTIEV